MPKYFDKWFPRFPENNTITIEENVNLFLEAYDTHSKVCRIEYVVLI
jgi:hypothetical protein